MTCDNCQQPAIYVYAPRQISPAHYCGRHLPTFLLQQAKDGLLETTDAYQSARQDALAKLSATAPVEAAPVEETAEDEPVVEEPKPKRRRAPRKKAQPAPEATE